MKRWIMTLLGVAGLAWLALATDTTSEAAPKKGETVTVRVMSAKLMGAPKFIGKTVTEVSRGAHLAFQDKKSSWYQVQTDSGQVGWIHSSAVVDKKVQLSSDPGGGGNSASQDEIELAGRGFTPEVEKEYRSKHRELDFSHVDKIEALTLDTEVVASFAAEGGVQ
ncbi:MAG TPA: SH3-like domain-containing protein [Kofleriaceae bacterium]|nr:SH3-like domain-containing protein [Kofleriaceae bacterium]